MTLTVTRGATNGNTRGNNKARAARRAWLVETYRADVDVIVKRHPDGSVAWVAPHPQCTPLDRADLPGPEWEGPVMACRCYRCGRLLTAETLTVDRIFPGILGGLYRTVRRDKAERVTNIRPACGPCNEKTGGALATRKNRKG